MTASLSAENYPDPRSSEFVTAVRKWVDNHFATIQADLTELVTHQSLAFDGYDREALQACSEAVTNLFRDVGLQELHCLTEVDDDGNTSGPAVIGRVPASDNKPTVLLYAHQDVQPVGDLSAWHTDPWVATEHQGRLYGRGTADDKAGIIVHHAALKALNELLGKDHGLGVTVFIEGEEEIGSPFFAQFLQHHRDLLAADTIVVADSSNWSVDVPALTTSLRGMMDGVIEVTVADHPVHSGLFGGPMPDAIIVLSRIIASLHDASGDVAVEGLKQTRRADVTYENEDFRTQTGAVEGLKLAGTGSLADRLWNKAALNIIGIDATPISESANAIVPTARARFSMRLGPGMDPHEAMEAVIRHVSALEVGGAKVQVHPGEFGRPFVVEPEAPATDMMKKALSDAWGTAAIETGLGGSIPFVADLVDAFPDASILLTGVEDPYSKAHSPNESLDLSVLRHAIEAEVLVLARMAVSR